MDVQHRLRCAGGADRAGQRPSLDEFLAERIFGPLGMSILSRPSVELMTADHLTPQQKAVSGLVPGFFEPRLGVWHVVLTRRDDVAMTPGTFGWDGGMARAGIAARPRT